ncbi:diguanylate cyclase (GGDEF domain) with PAS/PAC sensor [uncultured Candidatus Thioglobus sp.]|nr:diguanylate cyclase (GGDEF domain) with PAS/PAC sensor [uncultured Candidatus Thioglobus sp.]
MGLVLFEVFAVMRAVFVLFLLICLPVSALEKVSLRLLWLHQFEFAGFYIAQEKGFYADAGLEVDISQHNFKVNTVDKVVQGKIDYGVGRITLLKERAEGKKVVLLKSIFQISPLVLLGKKSQLSNIQDIKNKRVMTNEDTASSLAFRSMLSANKLDFDKDIIRIPHSYDIQSLVNDEVDLMSAYIYNEPYHLSKLGIEPIYFSPNDYGFEFYADILFTAEHELNNHPARVEKFIQASIKGWKYAFANINESAKLIYDKYNSQNKTLEAFIYEGEKLKAMAFYKNRPFGDISIDRLKTTYDIYRSMGLVNKDLNYTDFVYQDPKTNWQKTKGFVGRHIGIEWLIWGFGMLLLFILVVMIWNRTLQKKVILVVGQKLENERLIFRQNRIKEMATMMSGIAHQWRQPLNAISTSIINIDSIFQQGKLTQQTLNQKLDNIEHSVAFMSTTIDDFSHYLSADNVSTEFSINECVSIAVKLLVSEFLKHNIVVNYQQNSAFLYTGCRNELLQVLVIILNNAKEALIHNTNERIIDIKIEQNSVTSISINDNGCGIKKADLYKIFEPGFSTHSNHLDNGLGLYIARVIMRDKFSGEIKVESNKGATFTLLLGEYGVSRGGG